MLGAVRWIAKDDPAAAHALRDAAARAAEHIGQHRQIGSLRPDLAPDPYRFLVLSGFRHVLVYNADRKPALIVRILHGARDPAVGGSNPLGSASAPRRGGMNAGVAKRQTRCAQTAAPFGAWGFKSLHPHQFVETGV